MRESWSQVERTEHNPIELKEEAVVDSTEGIEAKAKAKTKAKVKGGSGQVVSQLQVEMTRAKAVKTDCVAVLQKAEGDCIAHWQRCNVGVLCQ